MKIYSFRSLSAFFICLYTISLHGSMETKPNQATYMCTNNTEHMLYYYPFNQDIADERLLHASPHTTFPIHTKNAKHLFFSIHPTKHKTSLESVHIPKNCKANGVGQIMLSIHLDHHHEIFAVVS